MKRILILFAFLALVASVNAQGKFSAKSWYLYTGVTADTAVSGTDCSVAWQVMRDNLYYYRVEVSLDEISGTANGIAILQGSLDGTNWTECDTLANTAGTEAQSADATVFIQDVTTGVLWKYMRIVENVSATAKWDINYIRFRAVGKND